jgi:hypothetical protein
MHALWKKLHGKKISSKFSFTHSHSKELKDQCFTVEEVLANMAKSEDKMIGYCGYNCHLCAARSDDINVRKKLVDAWRKYLGHQHYTAENVACEGCKSEGDKIADKLCKARPCAREKGLESCAQCNEFPCKKMSHLMGTTSGLLTFLAPKLKDITKEEFNLCIQQWNSMPNLVEKLVEEGKLPPFVLNRI